MDIREKQMRIIWLGVSKMEPLAAHLERSSFESMFHFTDMEQCTSFHEIILLLASKSHHHGECLLLLSVRTNVMLGFHFLLFADINLVHANHKTHHQHWIDSWTDSTRVLISAFSCDCTTEKTLSLHCQLTWTKENCSNKLSSIKALVCNCSHVVLMTFFTSCNDSPFIQRLVLIMFPTRPLIGFCSNRAKESNLFCRVLFHNGNDISIQVVGK